jgi:hypothetical protein
MTQHPVIYVDFNEMPSHDIVALSQTDTRQDVNGQDVQLVEGLPISIYSDDVNDKGQPDNLVAEGVVIQRENGWGFPIVKWFCRISPPGIRTESDLALGN